MQRGLLLTVGNTDMDMITFTQGRYLRINSHIVGLIFAAFKISSCVKRKSIILKIANERLMCSNNTQLTIRSISPVITNVAGVLLRVTALVPTRLKISGIERQFLNYIGRGAPYGPDDGTIAPWAAFTSLPFAPEIVLPTIDYYINEVKLAEFNPYGFKATFNPTYPVKSSNPYGWISPCHFGLNQGPIVLMIENYHTGLLWRLMRKCPYIANGLKRAGFSGGWL